MLRLAGAFVCTPVPVVEVAVVVDVTPVVDVTGLVEPAVVVAGTVVVTVAAAAGLGAAWVGLGAGAVIPAWICARVGSLITSPTSTRSQFERLLNAQICS